MFKNVLQKKVFRRLLVAFVVMLTVGGTVTAFAYWDNLSQTENPTQIVLGNGVELQVSETVGATNGEYLVPSSALLKANDVTSIQLTYTVKLSEAVLTAPDLTVTVESVTIDNGIDAEFNDTDEGDLVNVVVSNTTTVNDADVTVTVTITLDDPADAATYEKYENADINLELLFSAE